jgi:hypothetical protein
MDHWDPAETDGLAQEREVILFNNAGVSSSSGEVPTTFEEMAANAVAFIKALGLKQVESPRKSPFRRPNWSAAWFYWAQAPQGGHTAALKQLWELAFREASTLAYADAFRAIMIAFVIATFLVPLLRNIAATKPASAPSH